MCLHWNAIGIIWFYWFFIDISSSNIAVVLNAYLLEGEETIVEFVFDDYGWVKGDGHVIELKGTIRQQLEDQSIWQLLADLDSEGPVGTCGRSDGSWDIRFGVDVFKDNTGSKCNFPFHVTG